MQLEFNWYLVLKEEPEELEDGYWLVDDQDHTDRQFVPLSVYYRTKKDGARIYPVGGVVPIIKDDKAIGMAHIRECSQRLDAKNRVFTVVEYDQILSFDENDPVGQHYTDIYLAYKKKQEIENHGGKFKLEDYVNALMRRSLEIALKEFHGVTPEEEKNNETVS